MAAELWRNMRRQDLIAFSAELTEMEERIEADQGSVERIAGVYSLLGLPIADALQVYAGQMRVLRRAAAEQRRAIADQLRSTSWS